MGFLKCNPAWINKWFASDEEAKQLEGSSSLAEGDKYVLRYDKADGMRHGVAVSPKWLKAGYRTEDDLFRFRYMTTPGPW